jgi:hypothetical protein
LSELHAWHDTRHNTFATENVLLLITPKTVTASARRTTTVSNPKRATNPEPSSTATRISKPQTTAMIAAAIVLPLITELAGTEKPHGIRTLVPAPAWKS